MALAVIMLQGGLWEVFQSQESPWEDKLINMVTAIFGGGLLAGCIALIMTRIKKQ